MQAYTTVRREASFEYEDRKSVFIAEVSPVSSEEEALGFLASIKKKYPDANHHVYAYVLRENSIMRFSDDREPQGTAGMPVLDVIRKNSCCDVAIVVVRYFGGTLLGTGGLVRAYGGAAAGALRSAEIITYDIYTFFDIEVSYSDHGKILSVLESVGFRIKDTVFSDKVTVMGSVKSAMLNEVLKKITEACCGRAQFKNIEEKFDF